ncbi:hypothetical protein ACUN24_20095 [Pedobacter sp. WC2501]|uniref:hypothetical protein n=1 Tax=Pedobacter sp. WC2501 TaxID=3461400 RepID=UPI004045A123
MKAEIKTLADEIRKSIRPPEIGPTNKDPVTHGKSAGRPNQVGVNEPDIIALIRDFDCSGNTHMLHPRLNNRIVQLLNRLKLASGLDMNRVIAFALNRLFEQHPEIKKFIKTSLENFEL